MPTVLTGGEHRPIPYSRPSSVMSDASYTTVKNVFYKTLKTVHRFGCATNDITPTL